MHRKWFALYQCALAQTLSLKDPFVQAAENRSKQLEEENLLLKDQLKELEHQNFILASTIHQYQEVLDFLLDRVFLEPMNLKSNRPVETGRVNSGIFRTFSGNTVWIYEI